MAKKTDEKDILLVRDEKTGQLGVVGELHSDGAPRTVPAKPEHSKDFMTFDRHGDVIDNFFKNFFRQYKDPSRFGFYRIAADQAEKLLDVMKELLKDPLANAELLAPQSGHLRIREDGSRSADKRNPTRKSTGQPTRKSERNGTGKQATA